MRVKRITLTPLGRDKIIKKEKYIHEKRKEREIIFFKTSVVEFWLRKVLLVC